MLARLVDRDAARRLGNALILVTAAIVVVFTVAWPFVRGAAVNPVQWTVPHPLVAVCMLAFVAIASLGAGRTRSVWRFVASACLFAGWASCRVLTMGDGAWWRQATAEGIVSRAEPLSSLVYTTVHRLGGPGAIDWIPPVAGFVATWAWLTATDRLLGDRKPLARLSAATLWLASGVQVLFCHQYIEHTQLGIGALILGLGYLTAWTRRVDGTVENTSGNTAKTTAESTINQGNRAGRSSLVCGSALLTVAALSHLQYAGMLVAALGMVVLHGAGGCGLRELLRVFAPAGAAIAAVVAITAAAVWLSPCQLMSGSIYGGVDGRLLVAPAEVLAPKHVALVSNALWFAVPMALPFAVFAMAHVRARAAAPAGDNVVAAAGAAYLVFLSLFGFDLGWPRDADLLTSMSPALSLLVAVVIVPRIVHGSAAQRLLLLGCLAGAVAFTSAATARLIRPRWHSLSQQNTALAALFVDGVNAAADAAPYRVSAARGATFELRVRGTPGYSFWVLRGQPAPACEGNPYGSVADVRVGDLSASFVHYGALDERGEATFTWSVAMLPDGGWPGLQALVFPGEAHDLNVASAAYYFEPR